MYADSTHANSMAYYPDASQMYGATAAAPDGAKPAFAHGQRRRMNILPLGIALFVPWLLFVVVFSLLSFSVHYTQPSLTFAITVMCFLVVLVLGLLAMDPRKRLTPDGHRQPTWFIFLFVTGLLGWIAGVMLGDKNFYENMVPFYEITNLNLYTNVDPAYSRGEMLMDAGRIIFQEDARLDLQKSMGFRNSDTYCVAPISKRSNTSTDGSLERLLNYDFWAVGINCCTSQGPDFHCGQFRNPHAHGGLRLMDDSHRGFFRLAVQQAEAAFRIKATHPLFFTWMEDPVGDVNMFQDNAYKTYIVTICSAFVLQTFLVATAAVVFSKIGH